MGIERARVVEVRSPGSATGGVGSGYLVTDRLVLTFDGVVGRTGATHVRLAGTATWIQGSRVWSGRAGGAAIVEVEDPSELWVSSDALAWGRVTGSRPIPVTAMGFPAAGARTEAVRDARQFFGHLSPGGSGPSDQSVPVTASGAGGPPDDGMSGAALFAGAELVGVLLAGSGPLRAVRVVDLATDPAFVRLVGDEGGLPLRSVSAPPSGFAILGGRGDEPVRPGG